MKKSLAVFGLFLLAFGFSASADPVPSVGSILSTYPGCINSPSSDLGVQAADQVICGSEKDELCRLTETANCSSGSNLRMPTTNHFSDNNANGFAEAQTECNELIQKTADGCPEDPQSATPDPSAAQPAAGVHGAATSTDDAQTKLMTSLGKQAGVCRARKDFCSNRCGQIAKNAHDAQNADAGKLDDLAKQCNSKVAAREAALTKGAQTGGQNAQKAKEVAKQSGDGSDKQAAKDPTSKDPSTKDPSGKDPSATPSGGGNGFTPQSTNGAGLGNNNAGGAGGLAGLAQALQAMQQQQQQQQPQTAPTEPQSLDCGASVVGGKCGAGTPTAAAAQPFPKGNGSAGFEAQSKTGAGSFNPQSTSDSLIGSNLNQFGTGTPAKPGTAQTVANGGGQMLGGGGGGGGASLGATGGGSYQARQQQVAYNLGDAHGGGGYSQTAASMNTSVGGTSGWSGYGRDPANEGNIDLNQFLPGGKRDPTRGPAGLNRQNMQIQSKEVNIWTRISDHIRSRCSQGLLRDCVP